MHLQSDKLSVPLSPEIAGFAAVLEARLRSTDPKFTWKNVPYREVLKQLKLKVQALIDSEPGTEAFNRAVLVGMLAMMAADMASKPEPTPEPKLRLASRRSG